MKPILFMGITGAMAVALQAQSPLNLEPVPKPAVTRRHGECQVLGAQALGEATCRLALADVAVPSAPTVSPEGAVLDAGTPTLNFTGGDTALQVLLDKAPDGAVVVCEQTKPLTVTRTLTIGKPITLRGLKARLPEMNAAKNTTATFLNPGNYVFRVAIQDPGGGFTASRSTVTVVRR